MWYGIKKSELNDPVLLQPIKYRFEGLSFAYVDNYIGKCCSESPTSVRWSHKTQTPYVGHRPGARRVPEHINTHTNTQTHDTNQPPYAGVCRTSEHINTYAHTINQKL